MFVLLTSRIYKRAPTCEIWRSEDDINEYKWTKETKLRIHNITAKATLKFGSEALGIEEKGGTTFRSSTDEILETLTGNNKIG